MPLDSPAELPDFRRDHGGTYPTDDSACRDSHEMLPRRSVGPTQGVGIAAASLSFAPAPNPDAFS